MIGFEIHTYKDGRWRIDSIFDDREIAVFEARRIDESKRYGGVLVIEETYDDAANRSTWRTIFRGGRFANRLWGNFYAMQRKAERAETKSRRRKEFLPTAGERPPAPTGGFLTPLVMLVVLGACGFAALFALRHLFLTL
jgi:hypothetical protein